MQVNVVGRHFDLTEAIEQYATKKAETLPRYSDQVQQVDVIIQKQKVEYRVEFVIAVQHHADIVAHHDDDDLYACIDLATDKAVRRLSDWNDKLKRHRA